MVVVCINGSINSGKSTIARLLAERLPGARFVEGDDHHGHQLPPEEKIVHAVRRLAAIMAAAPEPLVMAYPLREPDFAMLRHTAAGLHRRLLVVTLAPPLEIALSRRGARALDEGEQARVRAMYREGYHQRPFSDLIIRGTPEPDRIVDAIAALVARSA